MDVSDKKLIRLCKDHHEEGYGLLLEKYEKYIYRLCYYYAHSKEDVLDLMQEVYIKIYRNMERFDENRPLLPWLKTLTVNVCLNFIRQKKVQALSVRISPDGEENSPEQWIACGTSIEQEITFLDIKRSLEQAIKELPEDMKTAVILRHVEGMSYQQIAEVMDLPLGTVKTHLFRGRRLLKDRLKNEGLWEV
ncbi:RNA polymerase sigma factor [Thermotalea metallivorans]|uniref:ECF RNA polymerase sigma factor SigW n=1 Tax=Thermotalea metallivorans TaxID=520762 RepID=A0A140KZR5_9FIRM|nr:RNA polymerase sigma factor [Thermotalea metallivorans]KXG73790.1 ECF RNA polymerase sigma factor SigW [Thermotalea metallivorans]